MPDSLAMRLEGTTVVAKSNSTINDYQWGLQSFLKEAKALAKYRDQNIVHILRYFEANGTAYIVMEFCGGGCLDDRIKQGQKFSEASLQEILTPIMNSLQLVHDDGVYHRDIKPDNIMFRTDGTPVLIDFGAARQAVETKTQTASSMCTPPYAAWEQYQTNGNIGPWTDIYGMAAVAYECLTGNRPPESVSRIPNDSLTPLVKGQQGSDFCKAIDWGLKVFEQERPQTLAEWYSSLQTADFTELDPLLEFAGADSVITMAEMDFLQKKAKQLGLTEKAALDYIITYAMKNNWQIQAESDSAKKENHTQTKTNKSKATEPDYHFKDPNNWYPIFQQALMKGQDNCCLLVPNDFSLSALNQLVKAAKEVNLHWLRPLHHHTAVAIGAQQWFKSGDYPLVVIGCHQEKIHACIAEVSCYDQETTIEILAYSFGLKRVNLSSQLDTLLKRYNLSAQEINQSVVYGDVAFLHNELDSFFSSPPLDQSQMQGWIPADEGVKTMNKVLKGTKTDFLVLNSSSYFLTLSATCNKGKSTPLLVFPDKDSLESISMTIPMTQMFYAFRHKEELWITDTLDKLTADSKPLGTVPYNATSRPTELVIMHQSPEGKLIPYKKFHVSQLQSHEAIKLTIEYETNGQICLKKRKIERLR